jgi:protein-S-isoprenylcysteine O-methyltransferase Ste14
MPHHRGKERRAYEPMKLNYATMALAASGLLMLGWHFRGLPWTAGRIAALIVGLPSLLLLTLARIQLGSAFSIRAKADLLVTTGIYARIRNPIYVFGGLTLASFLLWVGKPWFLLGYLVIAPLQVYRSRQEERVLTERFGCAYLEYKQKTWF